MRENNLKLNREMSLSYPDFLDWQRSAKSFQQMIGIKYQGFDLTNPGTPAHLEGGAISAGFFSALGVKLVLGREFSPEEDRQNGTPAVILSNRIWRDRFGGSAKALEQSVTLDGVDYRILGVLPTGFRLMDSNVAVYTPLAQGDPLIIHDRSIHPGIGCIARLKPGVTLEQARAEMRAIQDHLDESYPAANRGLGTDVVPLQQEIVGDVPRMLFLLLGAVGLVLLIACANVANLVLARAVGRTREFAIRTALGASRARIAAQLVTENVILSLAGGILGLGIAKWGVHPVLAAAAENLPRSESVGVNLPVLAFAFGVSIVVGILFGLAPAFKSWNADLQESLKEGARGSTGSQHRAQRVLVVAQMAFTLVLLTGTSLLLRTIHNLWQVNPGFNTTQIVTFKTAAVILVDQDGFRRANRLSADDGAHPEYFRRTGGGLHGSDPAEQKRECGTVPGGIGDAQVAIRSAAGGILLDRSRLCADHADPGPARALSLARGHGEVPAGGGDR